MPYILKVVVKKKDPVYITLVGSPDGPIYSLSPLPEAAKVYDALPDIGSYDLTVGSEVLAQEVEVDSEGKITKLANKFHSLPLPGMQKNREVSYKIINSII